MLPDTKMTLRRTHFKTFVSSMWASLKHLKVVAFTHKQTELSNIGLLHINDEAQEGFLQKLKLNHQLGELMYLSTCNRVEFVFTTEQHIDQDFLASFFQSFEFAANPALLQTMCESAEVYTGLNAVEHMFKVASSLDSMVVGEREIISQVRKSYEMSNNFGLTGDLIRLVVKRTIETAKQIYTETEIASKPVSVVSLAYQQLKHLNVDNDARILIVGAGITNTNMTRFLKKHGFTNFTVFNRTAEKAAVLANQIGGKGLPLSELTNFNEGFDVIITCTASDASIITPSIYKSLVKEDTDRKVVVDLAIPADFDKSIAETHPVKIIGVEALKEVAAKNIELRKKELVVCNQIILDNLNVFEEIYHERKVEIAMQAIPQKVKEIKKAALEQVFAKEMASLDESTKDLFNKMMGYMEKKYISVPMKMAKEIILEKQHKK